MEHGSISTPESSLPPILTSWTVSSGYLARRISRYSDRYYETQAPRTPNFRLQVSGAGALSHRDLARPRSPELFRLGRLTKSHRGRMVRGNRGDSCQDRGGHRKRDETISQDPI